MASDDSPVICLPRAGPAPPAPALRPAVDAAGLFLHSSRSLLVRSPFLLLVQPLEHNHIDGLGGWSFGDRHLVGTTLALCLPILPSLHWLRAERRRPALAANPAASSIAVQAIGASTSTPPNIASACGACVTASSSALHSSFVRHRRIWRAPCATRGTPSRSALHLGPPQDQQRRTPRRAPADGAVAVAAQIGLVRGGGSNRTRGQLSLLAPGVGVRAQTP